MAWLASASPEGRSEYGMNVDRRADSSPRPSSWHVDLLSPRDRKPSMNFPNQQPVYGSAPQDMDSAFPLAGPDAVRDQEQHPYAVFASPDARYTTRNSSSSSSLNSHPYGLPDPVYSQPAYPDSSFSHSSSFHFNNESQPSSYGSGRVSPLTPNDSVPTLHQPSSFLPGLASSKDFPPSFPDFAPDRRFSQHSDMSSEDFIPYSHSTIQPFPDRFGPDQRFSSNQSSIGGPSHTSDLLQGVPPLDVPHYIPSPHHDLPIRMPSGLPNEQLARVALRHPMMGSSDLQSFIRQYLDQYVRTPNRLAFGERTVIVMSSKVAQKSYGTEKRFLCPPPTAIMIGNSWWTEVMRRGEEPKLCPPRVVISISGEPIPQEGTIEWTGSSGKSFDVSDPPTGTTYIGRCVGKQLFISDVDEKKKKVEALVKITAPASDDEPERVIGVFPSRSIKVISKPSKKRQSAKNLELCINHGSTISLFHRLRSQTVSTKYLCVSGSGSSFKGSDGAPLVGLDQRHRATTPSFIARTASWDPFVMYIVDVSKPAGGIDAPPPPPPQPDYPAPPPNAIPFTTNGSQIPIYYNQTVVLQCLTSGVVSPVLIIRKVDHQTTVVGGGLQEGAKGVPDHYCAPGEVCGDPVSQLHKIAFEVYDASKTLPDLGSPGVSGAFLSCMGEKVNTYRPVEGRQWNTNQGSNSPILASSPISPTPLSSNGEYFASGSAGSAPDSPTAASDYLSNDGGKVKKKRSTSSAGGPAKSTPKGRRRPSSAASVSSTRRGSGDSSGASSGALWQVDIGETSVWTIVGTDQVRYNFYVPPVLFDNQHAPPTNAWPVPSKPVTPFPGVVKYLPPDRASEAPKANCAASRAVLAKPNPHASKMLTVYGENFSKTDPVTVFFGSEPSPYVEVRCTEVLGCLPPESQITSRRPIILVRGDGVVFPSSTMYP